ncbi:hypothetical protein pb186bvf_015911 [Paramecium bursaria]
MRLITNTNIIVDDFELCKDYPVNQFIHFLSHFHQDHWQGMTPLWNYGIIICTPISKLFIQHMFPKMTNIFTIEYEITYKLDLINKCLTDQDGEFVIKVTAFNAHHIPGSAQFLFEGYMGTILHTGDFRFNPSMLDYKLLLSKSIDEMIFDNTYCNPEFDFPTEPIVTKQIIDIIHKNKGKRILVAMGALGKENICIKISEYLQVPILVSEQKYKQLQLVCDMKHFTTDPKATFIEIIKKRHRQDRLEKEKEDGNQDFICITTDFLMLQHQDPDGINFMVPYSLHSNFQEMSTWVKAIKPAILKKLVIPFENFAQYRRTVKINPLKGFQNYLKKLEQNGQSGYSSLIKSSTDFTKLSKEYLSWMHYDKQKELLATLGFIKTEPDRQLRKRKIDREKPLLNKKQIIEELEKQYVFGIPQKQKKEGLGNIAERLIATNKNEPIQKYLKKQKEEEEDENSNTSNDQQDLEELLKQFRLKK